MGRNFKQGMGNGNFLGLFNKCTTTLARMPKSYPNCISGAAPGSCEIKGELRSMRLWLCLCGLFASVLLKQLSSALSYLPSWKLHIFSPRLNIIKQNHKDFTLINARLQSAFSFYQANKIFGLQQEGKQVSSCSTDLEACWDPAGL